MLGDQVQDQVTPTGTPWSNGMCIFKDGFCFLDRTIKGDSFVLTSKPFGLEAQVRRCCDKVRH